MPVGNKYPSFGVSQDKRTADLYGGRVYHAETGSGAVANNGELNLIFRTNNRIGDVLTVNALAGNICLLEIGEITSINVAGTGEPLRNFNRIIGDSTVTATVTAQGSYTGFDGFFTQFFGANGPGTNGGGGGTGYSFILPNSTSYVARVTNLSGGATNVNLEVEWAAIGETV